MTMLTILLLCMAFGVLLFASISLLDAATGDKGSSTASVIGGVLFGAAMFTALVISQHHDKIF